MKVERIFFDIQSYLYENSGRKIIFRTDKAETIYYCDITDDNLPLNEVGNGKKASDDVALAFNQLLFMKVDDPKVATKVRSWFRQQKKEEKAHE